MTNEPTCAWCESEHIAGNREDVGRPLTNEEASAGFLAVHTECRLKMDKLFARLATKGVFVTVEGYPDE